VLRNAGSGPAVVTGGSGFIGRAVVATLVARGWAVRVVDRDPFPGSADVELVRGDLLDPAVRERALAGSPAGVVHLAAVTSVLRSVADPAATYRANVELTQHLLELARERAVPRFVLASTNAVVGDVGSGTISEQNPLRPLTPYGATKAACEMLLSGYTGAYGMQTRALRFTNVYGPGMAAKDSFVPRLMRAAQSGAAVQIYGDGRQVRDLVHVDDVGEGVALAWERTGSGPLVLGSGRSLSVLELLAAARRATGRPILAEHVPAKQGEMPAVVVDIARARAELGYAPSVALTDGLREVWREFAAAAAVPRAGA
jgi:UDP-glucose 4-epimerase